MELENSSVLVLGHELDVSRTLGDSCSTTDLHRRLVSDLQEAALPDPNAVAEYLDGARRQIERDEIEHAIEHSPEFAEELVACQEILKLMTAADVSSPILPATPATSDPATIARAATSSVDSLAFRETHWRDADPRLSAALEAKSRGDFFRAVAEFTAVLQADPRNSMALAHRGETYRQMGEYHRAVADCTASLEIDPSQAEAFSHRALSYRLLGKVELAVADFGKAIELEPANSQAYNNRGDAYEDLKKHDLAVADYSKAIQLDPDYLWAWQNRGRALLASGEYELAISDFTQVLRLDQRFSFAWILRGDAYRLKGEAERAIGDYGAALKLDPRSSEAYQNRSEAHLQTGELEKALADLDAAARLAPKNATIFVRRGKVQQQLNQFEKAIADFDEALRLDRTQADVFHSRGVVHRLTGDHARAYADFDRTLALDPTHAHAWNNRGSVHAARADYKQAIADYSEAIRLDAKFVRAYVNRALAFAKTAQPDKVIPDCTRALELDRKLAHAFYFRGSAHAARREYGQAIADFSEALALDPKYTLAYNDRGLAYSRSGKYDEAIADYSEAIELDPQSPLAWANRGLAYQLSRQHDLALGDFGKAAFLDSKYVVAYCAQRGLALAARGRYESAIVDYTVALRLDPRNAKIQRNRDDALKALSAQLAEGAALPEELADENVLDAEFVEMPPGVPTPGPAAEEVTQKISREETLDELLGDAPAGPGSAKEGWKEPARRSAPTASQVWKAEELQLKGAAEEDDGDLSLADLEPPAKKTPPAGTPAVKTAAPITASQVWRAEELQLESTLAAGKGRAAGAPVPAAVSDVPSADSLALAPASAEAVASAALGAPISKKTKGKRPSSPTASQMWRADELREQLGLAPLDKSAAPRPGVPTRPVLLEDRRKEAIEELLFDDPAPGKGPKERGGAGGKQRGDSDIPAGVTEDEKSQAAANRFKGGKSGVLKFDADVLASVAAEEAKKPAAGSVSSGAPTESAKKAPPPRKAQPMKLPSFDFDMSGAGKWVGLAAAAAIVVVMGSFFFGDSMGGQVRPVTAAEVTTSQLVDAYVKDPRKASQEYTGQLIGVKGTIVEVFSQGDPRVVFREGKIDIECRIYHPDLLKGKNAGDEVTLVGECEGRLKANGPVTFIGCRFF